MANNQYATMQMTTQPYMVTVDPYTASISAHPQPTKTMTRLTTFNDWTILLEDGKLIAVDSFSNTVRAKGELLSAGGRAWMWKDGLLWSGELERHESEKEIRDTEKRFAADKIRDKHNKKIALAEKKLDELNAAKSQALRSL